MSQSVKQLLHNLQSNPHWWTREALISSSPQKWWWWWRRCLCCSLSFCVASAESLSECQTPPTAGLLREGLSRKVKTWRSLQVQNQLLLLFVLLMTLNNSRVISGVYVVMFTYTTMCQNLNYILSLYASSLCGLKQSIIVPEWHQTYSSDLVGNEVIWKLDQKRIIVCRIFYNQM